MSVLRLVLATRNAHKVVELRRILADARSRRTSRSLGIDTFPEVPDVAETGVTFAENALLKARAVAAATGLPAVADDSGLCVDVLGGAPGSLQRTLVGAARRRPGEPRAAAGADRRRARRAPRRLVRLRGGARAPAGAATSAQRAGRRGAARRGRRPASARHERLRLRPDLRARGRHPHAGRATPRPRRTRSATAAAPSGRSHPPCSRHSKAPRKADARCRGACCRHEPARPRRPRRWDSTRSAPPGHPAVADGRAGGTGRRPAGDRRRRARGRGHRPVVGAARRRERRVRGPDPGVAQERGRLGLRDPRQARPAVRRGARARRLSALAGVRRPPADASAGPGWSSLLGTVGRGRLRHPARRDACSPSCRARSPGSSGRWC